MNPGQIFDAYKIINKLSHQALGENAPEAVDTSTFVSVGEKILKTGYENVLNALSVVVFKTIFSARPYRGNFDIMRVDEQRYGGITRKVMYGFSDAEPSQDVNISGISGFPDEPGVNNLADGNSIDMYSIKNPKVIQLNFYGQQALQDHITRHVHALDQAFSSESEFMQFISGMMVNFYNSIVVKNEAKARAVLLNRIAGQVDMGLAVVDLVAEYNKFFGTAYTREQLLSTNVESFMQYVASEVMVYSDRLADMNTGTYHANVDGGPLIQRHTPKERQRMIMYSPIFRRAETLVYSGLFNPQYLQIGDFEGVNFWQSQKEPEKINITPGILNTTTGATVKGNAVSLDYVLGILYDEEGLGWVPVFDRAVSTPLNAAALYWNTYYHWLFSAYNDYTENAVVFILGEGGAGQIDVQHVTLHENSVGNPIHTMTTIPNTLDVASMSGSFDTQTTILNGSHLTVDSASIKNQSGTTLSVTTTSSAREADAATSSTIIDGSAPIFGDLLPVEPAIEVSKTNKSSTKK